MNKINSHDEPQSAEKSVGRRRFVRGVGIAVPVALTISARSALSATCTTQSAAASIALNNSHNATGDVNQPCQGVAPGSLTLDLLGANDEFSAVFTTWPADKLKKSTVFDVLSSKDGFAKHIAAAYINSKSGKVAQKFYTVQNLKDMWTYGPSGAYQPVPGANWDKTKIKTYLKDTWS